ncbi:ABC transporter permease [Paenibacillus durus]|uniref:Transport permease protein n=1 Tax=Paenibacillus durus TaxID=44251 RepID=A0A089J0N6_PAEDU|nr:ABC transporter permease [Paenibacillus durus]AIQ14754.1 teichoic acid ABC transporter permease [Paenibacillus durus]
MLKSSLQSFKKQQKFIIQLSKDDFRRKYAGSYLGIAWAFIQPTISLLIFWFVFQVGLKSQAVNDVPFILWLSAAMIPWNFFADALQSATNAITETSFLVKKVVFKVQILPLVKIYTSLSIHLFFIVFLFVLFSVYGYYPDLYYIQIPYYIFCMFILLLGLSWITSALVVFLKDVGQVISMILQFGFWLTPIFYSYQTLPVKYDFLIKLNPLYYITEGYRGIFIYKFWFWERPDLTLYYWIVSLSVLIVGYLLFRRLRPHFADVL